MYLSGDRVVLLIRSESAIKYVRQLRRRVDDESIDGDDLGHSNMASLLAQVWFSLHSLPFSEKVDGFILVGDEDLCQSAQNVFPTYVGLRHLEICFTGLQNDLASYKVNKGYHVII